MLIALLRVVDRIIHQIFNTFYLWLEKSEIQTSEMKLRKPELLGKNDNQAIQTDDQRKQ